MEFFHEPENWVAVAFVIFLGVLAYVGVHKKMIEALDHRSARIKAEHDKPLPKLAITLPATAKEIQATKSQIEFKLSSGKPKTVIDGWRKQLAADGWKEQTATLEDIAGAITFIKGEQDIMIMYQNTGISPAEVTVHATGVELEQAAEKK